MQLRLKSALINTAASQVRKLMWNNRVTYFSKNAIGTNKKAMKEVLVFKEMGKITIYLVNSFIFSRNKFKKFGRLKDRVQAHLEGWNCLLFPKIGKVTLIKSIVQAIPTYIMYPF